MPKHFSEFAKEYKPLSGDKLKISDILNKEIMIIGFKIKPSKVNENKCLTIQFLLGEAEHIFFSGSNILIEQIEKYKDEMPFLSTVKKIGNYFSFT